MYYVFAYHTFYVASSLEEVIFHVIHLWSCVFNSFLKREYFHRDYFS